MCIWITAKSISLLFTVLGIYNFERIVACIIVLCDLQVFFPALAFVSFHVCLAFKVILTFSTMCSYSSCSQLLLRSEVFSHYKTNSWAIWRSSHKVRAEFSKTTAFFKCPPKILVGILLDHIRSRILWTADFS